MTRDNEHTLATENIFDAFARIYKRDWNDPEAADLRDQFERGWSAGQDSLLAGHFASQAQEPVAYGVLAANTGRLCQLELAEDYEDAGLGEIRPDLVIPLYTAPVAAQAQPDHFRGVTKMVADAAECLDTLTSDLNPQHPLRQQALNEAKGHVANLYGIASGAAQARPEGVMVKPQQPSRYPHITLPYTLAEIEARMATHDYSAELLLQHAMLLLQAQQPVSGADGLSVDIDDVRQYLDAWGCLEHPGVRALVDGYQPQPSGNSLQVGDRRLIDGQWLTCSDPEIGRWQSSGNAGELESVADKLFSEAYQDGMDGDEFDMLRAKRLIARAALASQASGQQEIQRDIETLLTMLGNHEYAEHWAKTEIGQRLEAAMTAMHDELNAAQASGQDREDAERLDWLQKHDGRFYNKDRISSIVGTGFLVAGQDGCRHQTIRDAIDAARAAAKEQA